MRNDLQPGSTQCVHCSKEKGGRKFYCSRPCYHAAMRLRTPTKERPCEHCGNMMTLRLWGTKRFCSRLCVNTSRPGRISQRGYVKIAVPDHPRGKTGGYVYEHILIAEKALGYYLELPHIVHHHDEIGWHNENTNLVICEDIAYHKLLHQRMRVIKAGGDPNTDKMCGICRVPRHRTQFHKSRTRGDGLNTYCMACAKIRGRLRPSRAKLIHKEGQIYAV